MASPNITVSKTELSQAIGEKSLRSSRAGGDGTEFPLRVAKVTRVDPKQLVVDLITFTGNHDTYESVALTFPNAGARHFLGAIPDVNDLCIIDYSPAESGTSRTPYIVGWLVPGTDVGYDWLVSQLTDPKDLELNPKTREVLEGVYGRRRHKLRQMEPGNIVASSSQGSDIILSEDLLLANRRGNEILLRDSDQSLVVRTLQQFHVGSGFRVYSGMVQRDSNLLPRQLFSDGVDYTSPKQLDDDGVPIPLGELEPSELEDGLLKTSEVFENKDLEMGVLNPKDILSRGMFIDEEGLLKNPETFRGSTYGGKSFYRVSKDSTNSVPDTGTETFTEYRIEVSHTADGTLPVTEQTDGIDIDRLPQNQISDDLGDFEPNSQNKSINTPMVEMVMGTVIGNDPINEPESYGVPLVATIFDANGGYNPTISPATPGTPISSHLAWLVKIRNPTSNTPPAFMAITKGGALKSYFPGVGSESLEEYFAKGRTTGLGIGTGGVSQLFDCEGSFHVQTKNADTSTGNGITLDSSGSMRMFAGGYNLFGSSNTSGGDSLLPSEQQLGLHIETPHSTLVQAGKDLRLQGSKRIFLEETNVINMTSNNSINLTTESSSFNFKTYDTTVQGETTNTYSGTLTETFNASALTGFKGGAVIERSAVYGGREEQFKVGRLETRTAIGSVEFMAMSTAAAFRITPEFGPGNGISLSSGVEFFNSRIDVKPLSISMEVNSPGGPITIEASKGPISIHATLLDLKSTISTTLRTRMLSVRGTLGLRKGNVLTDGCKDTLTGRSFFLSGCSGHSGFKVS